MSEKIELKTILKRFLTEAVMAAITIAMVGCSCSPQKTEGSYQTESQAPDENNESEGTIEVGSSYNAYLYSAKSLNEVILTDTFGLVSSKYTDNADRRLEEGSFLPIEIQLSSANYNEFVDWIDCKEVVYVYADLYNLENAYRNIAQYNSQIAEQEYRHKDWITEISKKPTVDQVYNKIITNSTEYLKSHTGCYNLDSNYIKLIAELLVNMVSDYSDDLSEIDLARIYCMLNDVKAVGIDSMDFTVNDLKQAFYARVTDDAVVMLDSEMIKQLHGDQAVSRTIAHEVAHLLQRMCPDHKIAGLTQIGNSQYVENFDNTGEVNSLHFQWLYEAAAEQLSMNVYDAKTPLVYENMVGYLHTLDLITLIGPDCDENSIAVSQMSTNPNAIFNVFGASTQEEKEEIAHMLYSICYIQTDREDFAAAYEKKYGEIEGEETTVKKVMKESVAQTMIKYFYKNLAERVHNGGAALQDIFYLINVFESALSRHFVYDDPERYEYNDESISFYLETQDKFFELIARDSGFTYEDIVEEFLHYALIVKTDSDYQRNYRFSWLDQDEKDYVGTVLTTNIQSLTTNIRALDIWNGEQ